MFDFETPLGGGWYLSDATFVISSAQKHQGAQSALLTSVGTPAQAYVRAPAVTVLPGASYTARFWAYRPIAGPMTVSIDWASGSTYLSTTSAQIALTANTWTLVTVTGTAPTNADGASYGPTVPSNPANGTQVYVDELDFIGPSITTSVQDVYPPRVLVSVLGLTVGNSVELYRVVEGVRTKVRGASSSSVTDAAFIRVDAELPFGVPVTYVAVVNSTAQVSAAPITVVLAGEKPVITDAITGVAAEAVTVAWDEWNYDVEESVFKVGGRTVVISGELGMYQTSVELFLEAGTSVDNFMNLLRSATSKVLQIRNSLGESDYVHVSGVTRRRFSQDRTDERRLFILTVLEVEPWAAALQARAYNLQDIANYYGTSGTLQDIADDFDSLLGIAQGDFS